MLASTSKQEPKQATKKVENPVDLATTPLTCCFCKKKRVNAPIRMHECNCQVGAHQECLDDWFKKHGAICPLCTKKVRIVPTTNPNQEFEDNCAVCCMGTFCGLFCCGLLDR